MFFLAALAVAGTFLNAEQDKSNLFTQKPTIAPSQFTEGEDPDTPKSNAPKKILTKGPAANWIWSQDPNQTSWLRKEFDSDSKSASLRASCDNVMTIWLNDKQIARSSEWQSPVTVDVQKHLKPGKNVLLVKAENQGGPSGFALKLAMLDAKGKAKYLITDKSWDVAATKDAKEWKKAKVLAKMGSAPWGNVFNQSGVGNVTRGLFQVLPGFQVELLYTVPKGQSGSWVSITFDNKGRLIASDQGGKGLCRITPPPIGSDKPTQVEPLNVKITSAQGMLYAFDSLYLSVNGGPGSGLYRARDTNGDDQFDKVEKLKSLRGGGEHGPHALRLSPDGKSIYIIAGNSTNPPANLNASRIPTNWSEDLLLPRQWDANGHARGRLAPGGWIAKTDPEGKTWELFSSGYRNPYSMDFNADGELFAYDADMEWDMGSPWYRPTRVVHATSGSEFGWRSGTGKWPTYYADSLPPLVNIGPGSPVGARFGYGLKFPAKYQKAFYICDWTFGTMYAIHIEPDGASYKATKEEFVARAPLPLTDVAMGPDGAMYFTIGGRGTQSELYRVTYVGKESTKPVDAHDSEGEDLRKLRRDLEAFHAPSKVSEKAMDLIWKNLGHSDRFIRYAARIAMEHQSPRLWQDRVLKENDPHTLIIGAIAFARQGDKAQQKKLLDALDQINYADLSETQQLDLLRAWALIFIRMGEPDKDTALKIAKKLEEHYPAKSYPLNRELSRVLVYLKAPNVVSKTIALMQKKTEIKPAEMEKLLARNRGYGGTIARMLANQPEIEKLHYAFVLRNAREGWTLGQRKFYYQWLQEAATRSGGSSYRKFIANIDKEAWDNTNDTDRLGLQALKLRKPYTAPALPKPKGPGREWKVEEVLAAWKDSQRGRNFANGKRAFAAARCVVCHRFDGDGGATGPDLTQLAGRFNAKDLTEALLDPSKVISDQYRSSVIRTKRGTSINGRILAKTEEALTILVDPEDSTKVVTVDAKSVETIKPSPTSMMPQDLLKPLSREEVLDLLAYLLSRGNPRDPLFRR